MVRTETYRVNIVPTPWQTSPVPNGRRPIELGTSDYRVQTCALPWNHHTDPENYDKSAEQIQNCNAGPGAEGGEGEKKHNTATAK